MFRTSSLWHCTEYTAHPEINLSGWIYVSIVYTKPCANDDARSTPYRRVAQHIKSWLARCQVPMPEKHVLDDHLFYADHDNSICTYTTFESGETRWLKLLSPLLRSGCLLSALPVVQITRHGERSISCGPFPPPFVSYVETSPFSFRCYIFLHNLHIASSLMI